MDDEINDYGLAPGESFDPGDLDEEEPFDVSKPHIMTLLGPIEPDDLGFTIFVGEEIRGRWEIIPGSAAAELELAHYSGLRAVAVLGYDPEQNEPEALLWIAQRVPIHFIDVDQSELGASGWFRIHVGQGTGSDVATRIALLAEDDQVHRIIISFDQEPAGSNQMIDILELFPLKLMEAGLSAIDVRTLFVDNPSQALTRIGTPSRDTDQSCDFRHGWTVGR